MLTQLFNNETKGRKGWQIMWFKLLILCTVMVSWPSKVVDVDVAHANLEQKDSCDANIIENLKNNLNPSDPIDKIVSNLGTGYSEQYGAMENNLLWRFDICAANNYQYQLEGDAVDLKAIQDDKVMVILYVSFANQEDDKIDHITMYYKNNHEQLIEVKKYRDGYVKETLILY
ncbi:hypothetical protein J9303_02765 [Bacillaceae bacterium Marseille-Q3522]|nr:hypothetical protein [Bacillaceae bacterium Marseille-Q3522]